MRTTSGVAASAIIAAAAGLLAMGAAAIPAAALPEPAPTPASAQPADGPCLLERLGTQFVRCDDLTGAGVPAPPYVPQRG